MAKDRKKLQHIHSSVLDKQPTAASLEVGEIAVNNAAGKEFISLKNSSNKVVRLSSDEQIIDWVEKKEVIPYAGEVSNIDLENNISFIGIKLNQVVADNTVKHDVVNGAIYSDNTPINPSSDGGLTDGAGFAINMSNYAMIGANPSFSSLTSTTQTNLSGDLTIDVNNANENIVNKVSTIGTETTSISGDSVLNVEGDYTESHSGSVIISNHSGYTANTSGTTEINSTGNIEVTAGESLVEYANYIVSDATGSTGGNNFIHGDNYVQIKAGDVVSYPTIAGSGVNIDINCNGDYTKTVTNNNTIDVVGDIHTISSGNTSIHADGRLGLSSIDDIIEATENNINITANNNIYETAGSDITIFGKETTTIGTNNDGCLSVVTNVIGNNINLIGETIIDGNLTVNDNLSVSGAIINYSDEYLKDEINSVDYDKLVSANNVPIKEFYFKSDKSRKKYGIIAQDVESNGLEELVFENKNGIKGVDYIALLCLKINYLEKEIKELKNKLEK